MAEVEYYIGTTGPFFVDDTDPLWSDPGQMVILSRIPTAVTASKHTEDVEVTNTSVVLLMDATSGDRTVTLSTTSANVTVVVKKIDDSANKVTLAGTIDGSTNLELTLQNENVKIIYDGTEWWVIT